MQEICRAVLDCILFRDSSQVFESTKSPRKLRVNVIKDDLFDYVATVFACGMPSPVQHLSVSISYFLIAYSLAIEPDL